ncbi:hypothetical protein ACFORJ_01780 [Corynebacterium hansenii]|uniref:Uncharacterized protein n=1 Tax=Corynebacterium hansenii TaxID=394964 RepID=A0ABV7ZME2_9CORY|nr:hypothetical protein [Corynebacterium hansenii]WJY99271.1 hypothetical protein CHAN_03215 [Corynebacterium hansenii]
MSTPERATEIVDEMVDRLRVLQGSGEFVPLGRRVIAGTGLAGGGTLVNDITVSLSPDATTAIEKLTALGDTAHLATDEEVTAAIAPLARRDQVAPRIVYRDFSVLDPPASQITAPPLRIDADCQAASVSVSVGTPGTRSVTATVGGQTITVAPGGSQGTKALALAFRAGDVLRLTVGSTDAAGIVVSVRLEEPGVTS